jgi:ATP-dependent DNA ligase
VGWIQSICFRNLDEFELGSRNERPMTRYFPELVAAVTAELPERCVIDGGIIIATDHGLDFEALQQRIHPADSRADATSIASVVCGCLTARCQIRRSPERGAGTA